MTKINISWNFAKLGLRFNTIWTTRFAINLVSNTYSITNWALQKVLQLFVIKKNYLLFCRCYSLKFMVLIFGIEPYEEHPMVYWYLFLIPWCVSWLPWKQILYHILLGYRLKNNWKITTKFVSPNFDLMCM